jgi:hypothetical protein
MTTTLSRRGFLIRGSAVSGAVLATSFGLAAPATADARPTAWVLRTRGGCRCSACRAHAANRVFASAADASSGRAHPGCRCTAIPVAISPSVYRRCFAGRSAVDRRHPGVEAIFASDPVSVASGLAQADPIVLSERSPDGSGQPPTPAGATNGSQPTPHASATGRVAPPLTPPSPHQASASPRQGSASPHQATGKTTTSFDISAVEWTPLPIAASALGLMLWLRNRREDIGRR